MDLLISTPLVHFFDMIKQQSTQEEVMVTPFNSHKRIQSFMQQILIECQPYAKHTVQVAWIILVNKKIKIFALVKHISRVKKS